jgi:predicted Zn-dependent peptidase
VIRRKLALALAALMTLPGTALAQHVPPKAGPPRPVTIPAATDYALANGMRVTLVPYGTVPKATAYLVTEYGGNDEATRETGAATLAARLLPEGTATETADQIAARASLDGGALRTGSGATTSYVGTDALSERTADAIGLIGDVARAPAFPDAAFTRVTANLMRGYAVARGRAQVLAMQRWYGAMFPGTAFGRNLIEDDAIKAATVAGVRAFYQRNVGATRSHLYVIGRFDDAAVRAAIDSAFGSWAAGPARPTRTPLARANPVRVFIDRPGAVQSTIFVGTRVPPATDKDRIALTVADALLGGSFASRITQNIREAKGYTYSPFSAVQEYPANSAWYEVADVTTNVTGPALTEIFKEINRLGSEQPSRAEVDAIERYLTGSFVLGLSTRFDVLSNLWTLDELGLPPSALANYVSDVQAVTAADISRVVKAYLVPDKMTLVVVGDKKAVAPQLAHFGTFEGL